MGMRPESPKINEMKCGKASLRDLLPVRTAVKSRKAVTFLANGKPLLSPPLFIGLWTVVKPNE